MSPELDDLNVAVQRFVAQVGDANALVSQALVIWECVFFGEDGEPQRQISYACPTDNFSPSGALGLLESGRFYIRRDVLGDSE